MDFNNIILIILVFLFVHIYKSTFIYKREDFDKNVDEFIDVIYYINLDHRTDRKEQLLNELKKINFPESKIVRIPAIKRDLGDVGCSHSHIKALETFLSSSYNIKNCLILEDDFEFIQTKDKIYSMLNSVKQNNIDYDVLMFSSNTVEKNKTQYDFIDKIINAQTTSGYMVSRKFAPILLENYKKGILLLEESYSNNIREDHKYAVDQYWKLLQPNNNWYLFNPKFGKQRASYSDIIKGDVNYETFINSHVLWWM